VVTLLIVSNMRCDGAIAEIGDEQVDFKEKCGTPIATEENGRVWICDCRPPSILTGC
jgi:hypothetical protein